MPHSPSVDLEMRIRDYEAAMATFARLHEELTELREIVTVPEAAARLEVMLQLNAETLDAIKRSLALALGASRRSQHPFALIATGS